MSALRFQTWSETVDREAFAETFAELPARVRREPYRAALPPAAHWKTLLELPLPLEFWLVEHEGRAVGRVGASLSSSCPAIGYLGFFEVDIESVERDAAAAMLLDLARAWLGARGVRRIYGPVDLATWFSYRFRVPSATAVDEDTEAPFAWEPVNPPEYFRWFATRGFAEAERYHSQAFAVEDPALMDQVVCMSSASYEQARSEGFAFRIFDAARPEAELSALYAVSTEAFRGSFLFEPLAFPTFRTLGAAMAARFTERLTHFVLDASGREAGFVYAFVDRGYAVIKTLAVRPGFRGRKLSTALLHLVLREAGARGVHRGISALVKRGGPSELLGARHEQLRGWRHDYALFTERL
jgi:N-acetylglutamate synthase-like GNAT family acetyltransferase